MTSCPYCHYEECYPAESDEIDFEEDDTGYYYIDCR